MLTLRHDGEPTATGKTLAVVALHVSDLPDLMTHDHLVYPGNHSYHEAVKTDIEQRHNRSFYQNWYGGLTSARDALKLIDNGWSEGGQRASAAAEGIPSDQLARPESIRRKIIWGEEGDRLDWERALNGDVDTMWGRSKRRRTSAPRMLSLAADYGGNCDISAEQLFWNGAQMVVTAEMLQAAGYQIQVRGLTLNDGDASYDGRKAGFIDIIAKDYTDPLRLDMIAAVFSHAGVYRTYGFQAYFRLPWDLGYGYGHHQGDLGVVRAKMQAATDAGLLTPVDVYIPTAYTKKQAVQNIVAAITSIENRGRAVA